MWRYVDLYVVIKVSDKKFASIFKAEVRNFMKCTVCVQLMLKIDEICPSEMLVPTYKYTLRHNHNTTIEILTAMRMSRLIWRL
jgi:hypothetical protein